MFVDELVESILASIQWDRWRFLIPTAKPQLRQDVAVVSHSHMDHWHPNFYHKDLILVPWELQTPEPYCDLRNILRVKSLERIRKMQFLKINGKDLREFLGKASIPTPHCIWWIIAFSGARVLFIGDMNVFDVRTANSFIEKMFEIERPLHGVLLPSFGGVSNHGAKDPGELSLAVRELAYEIKDAYNVVLGGLPHLVSAEWADYNAVRI